MLDLIMQLKYSFTDKDREGCLPAIGKIVSLAEKARTDGVMALETDLETEEDCFTQTALSLLVDGADAAQIKDILQNMIIAGEYSGEQLLRRLILAEGILAIQHGENPKLIKIKLHSILGEKYVQRLRSASMDDIIASMLNAMRDKQPIPESGDFEALLIQQPSPVTQRILREIDWHCLVRALQGCGINLISKIAESLSKNTAIQLCEALQSPRNSFTTQQMLSAQTKIRKVLDQLEGTGEMFFISD